MKDNSSPALKKIFEKGKKVLSLNSPDIIETKISGMRDQMKKSFKI